ncbi:hypothetical protein, conserved [Eimeria tenella]|uniref:Leucine rich repeat protein n=1 Tax=Eimeria tenella TaxID=5802 RepID=U6KWD5_EIMTE|nr:hypothetical protein, conserved [Eimeria tenella]CDJ42286.1 hypothetical protein, conserved [Eimeria tenella]|eukprot:XP_013233036.1 hypothetical protein, conserved [Eimeria tenella]
MQPNAVAAVAADAAVAVAAAAAAAAEEEQARGPTSPRGPSYVDMSSYLVPEEYTIDPICSSSSSSSSSSDSSSSSSSSKKWQVLRVVTGHWSPCTVTVLCLSDCELPEAALRELCCCSNLLLLLLQRCSITDACCCSNLLQLQRLLLPENKIKTLEGLKGLPKLEEISLIGNPIETLEVPKP